MVFFPSVPIHEDDGTTGEYYLKADGCFFELTAYRPTKRRASSFSVTLFDLSDYNTDPNFVHAPFSDGPLSRRYTVLWNAMDIANTHLVRVDFALRAASLSFRDRRNLGSSETIAKQRRLAMMLVQVENGEFGQFATRNHVKSYVNVGSVPQLVSVHILKGIHLPVERDDGRNLIVEMDNYRSEYCSES